MLAVFIELFARLLRLLRESDFPIAKILYILCGCAFYVVVIVGVYRECAEDRAEKKYRKQLRPNDAILTYKYGSCKDEHRSVVDERDCLAREIRKLRPGINKLLVVHFSSKYLLSRCCCNSNSIEHGWPTEPYMIISLHDTAGSRSTVDIVSDIMSAMGRYATEHQLEDQKIVVGTILYSLSDEPEEPALDQRTNLSMDMSGDIEIATSKNASVASFESEEECSVPTTFYIKQGI
jgi:hypothetical protein